MPSSDARDFDIAIIGGGTMGLSAAYYAAAAGHRTVLFEQFDFYNDRGSSDGDSRMFRVLYSDANMARLAETSLGLWNEIAWKSVSAAGDNSPPLTRSLRS